VGTHQGRGDHAQPERGGVMSRRKGNGALHAPATAATAEPAIYYKTPVTPEEAFQAIGRLRREARDEIDRLIRFLDETDNHMERKPDDEGDESEIEPSLGSFDRTMDQSKARRQTAGELCFSIDAEQDDADHEDSDPAEEAEASGIADQDGLDEQVPFRDWQGVGMV
jgi:hypothetical protein